MAWEAIRKSDAERARSNLRDYDLGYRSFSWADARVFLASLEN